MSTCTMRTGFLLWRKFCGAVAIGNCRDCRAFVCERHSTRYGDGAVACSQCVARVEDDDDSTGTVFSSGPLAGPALGAAAGAAVAAEPARPDTWHGGEGGSAESSSGDSSSGDSGGGDSGSSSTD